jgi:hypothetical protein
MSKRKDENKRDLLNQEFYKRLSNYELPVSEEVWKKIESDLPKIAKPHKTVRIALRYCTAAAAIALVLSLGLYRYFYIHEDTLTLDTETIETKIIEKSEPVRVITQEVQNDKETKKTKPTRRVVVSPKSSSGLYAENQNPKPKTETIIDAQQESPVEKPAEKAQESHPQPIQNFIAQTLIAQTLLDETEPWENLRMKKKKQKISIAVGYGNSGNSSLISTNSLSRLDAESEKNMLANYSSFPYLLRSAASESENKPIVSGSKYKMPVSLGLSVRKNVTDNWAVESGLTYTYLESSESLRYLNGIYGTSDVGLHYLGIPLKVIYSFYNNNRLSLYASVGGMAEKTVYGERFTSINNTNSHLDIPEVQWSVAGSVGVSYKLINHLSIFAEPGVGHYFDDKSAINTIRDDKPTNFNLQLGIRLSY